MRQIQIMNDDQMERLVRAFEKAADALSSIAHGDGFVSNGAVVEFGEYMQSVGDGLRSVADAIGELPNPIPAIDELNDHIKEIKDKLPL